MPVHQLDESVSLPEMSPDFLFLIHQPTELIMRHRLMCWGAYTLTRTGELPRLDQAGGDTGLLERPTNWLLSATRANQQKEAAIGG